MVPRPSGTYVYCLVAGRRAPPLTGKPAGLPGTGKPRLLEVGDDWEAGRSSATARERQGVGVGPHDLKKWLVVADAPLDRYDEKTINRGLSDVDWVARTAVAHEAVVRSFAAASAVLPMKLFTIFTSDERALDHVRRDGRRIDALIRRVAHHQEWGVRVVLDRAHRAAAAQKTKMPRPPGGAGKSYLARKKAQRDTAAELARRARDRVADLYDRLADQSGSAKRRSMAELPIPAGPLLLDAAFLVPVVRSARFRRLVAREARTLARHGYRIMLTGPWPPYSFVQD